MQVFEDHFPKEQQNQGQDMGIEHNALENMKSDHLLPSGQHQCRRKCKGLALPGNIYCEKHRLQQDKQNERKRNARPKRGSQFLMDPVLPSGQHQCRRTGRGWRCSNLAPPSKIYCQKHELEQNAHSEKNKQRKRLHRVLIGCDDTKSSSGDCLTVSKRTRKKVDVPSLKGVRERDSGKDMASEEPLFPVSEGVVDEHVDKNLSIAQIDSAQLLCVTLEDHQVGSLVNAKANPSIMEDNEDNQVIPVDPITRGESTVDSIEQLQSSNKVDDSLNLEFIDNREVLPLADIACSSPLHQEEAHNLLESGGCNLPDERSKTAAKEFVGEKQQSEMILARLNIRMEANELEQNANSVKRKKYRKRKDRGLTESEEIISSGGHYSTVVKRTKKNEGGRSIEYVRVESPKIDYGNDVASEKSLFLGNEGVVDEHDNKNLSIAQIDSAQLLNPILEEHQTMSFIHEKASPIMEDSDDNQLKPASPIST